MAKGRVLNQARFEAFGKECEINVGGKVEPAPLPPQAAAVAAGAAGGRRGVGIHRGRVKATFTEGEIVIGTGIGSTR